jgi:hypothetical protein
MCWPPGHPTEGRRRRTIVIHSAIQKRNVFIVNENILTVKFAAPRSSHPQMRRISGRKLARPVAPHPYAGAAFRWQSRHTFNSAPPPNAPLHLRCKGRCQQPGGRTRHRTAQVTQRVDHRPPEYPDLHPDQPARPATYPPMQGPQQQRPPENA